LIDTTTGRPLGGINYGTSTSNRADENGNFQSTILKLPVSKERFQPAQMKAYLLFDLFPLATGAF
jgi:hypothetical protein